MTLRGKSQNRFYKENYKVNLLSTGVLLTTLSLLLWLCLQVVVRHYLYSTIVYNTRSFGNPTIFLTIKTKRKIILQTYVCMCANNTQHHIQKEKHNVNKETNNKTFFPLYEII